MKKILLILVFVVSFLGAADLVGVDSNNTVQTVIEDVTTTTSIANNSFVNIFLYDLIKYFEHRIYALMILFIFIFTILYYGNKWVRIFTVIILLHITYQISGLNSIYPIIDIMYYGFASFSVSAVIRSFQDSFKKFENNILATKINLLLNIFDLLIFVLTTIFVVKSLNIQNIEVITTGIGLAFFIIIRKDLNNLKSFFIISWNDFISLGDKIVIDSKEGRILKISKFTTILQSDNGVLIKVPNSDLLENSVINKSKNKKHIEKEVK